MAVQFSAIAFLYVQMVATEHNWARSDQSRITLSHPHAGFADSQSQVIVNVQPLMNTEVLPLIHATDCKREQTKLPIRCQASRNDRQRRKHFSPIEPKSSAFVV